MMRELLSGSACRSIPKELAEIEAVSQKANFKQSSSIETGVLLKTLVASKPRGKFLELGTGAGHGAAWILEGMDQQSSLITVDSNSAVQDLAKKVLKDMRVEFVLSSAKEFMSNQAKESFDLVFADAWEGKYEHLELALSLIKRGGFYVIDDLLPQENWPEGQRHKIPLVQEILPKIENLHLWPLPIGTGYVVAVKR